MDVLPDASYPETVAQLLYVYTIYVFAINQIFLEKDVAKR